MAYKNLLAYEPTNKADVFIAVRDFLCKRGAYPVTGVGWTLFDSSYAVDEDNPQLNDWFVIYSPGESGDEDIFYYVKWISNGFWIWGYQAWNPTTNSGANAFGTTTTWSVAEVAGAGCFTWIYADLDVVHLIHEYTVGLKDYRHDGFGRSAPTYAGYTGEVATCSSSLSAGSDISIALDLIPAEWEVGDEIFIRTTHTNDNATVEIEKITIKTIVSNTITADLTNSYTAGCKLQNFVGLFCQNSTNSATTTKALIGSTGVIGQAVTWGYNTIYPPTTYDPEGFNRIVMLYQNFLLSTVGAIGLLKYMWRTPVQNTEFTNLDTIETRAGDVYRCFKVYSNIHIAMKEV